jgi:superfamily II DNA/RNA helicase
MLPFTRQTLFFSATMPPEIQRLADNFLHTPERIEVSPPATAASTIVQRLKKTSDAPAAKRQALRELMQEVDVKNAIIFCNRKKDVGVVYRSLHRHKFNVGALHGDMDQRQRMATLEAFRNGEIAFLVASDVAARGLDIPNVSHIFNYDVPVHPEDYVHRIGRTGRAGREGYAAMLVTPKDYKALKAIEAMLKEEITWLDGAIAPEEVAEAEAADRGNGRGRSRRGGRRGGQRTGRSRSEAKEAPASTSEPQNAAEGETAEPKRADDRRNDGRRGKRGQGKRAEGQQSAAQDRGKRNDAPRGKTQGGKSQGKTQGRTQGMGDHVPAFMMRPVRVP